MRDTPISRGFPRRDADSASAVEHRGSHPHWGVTRDVVGVFYDVYNELGRRFLEPVYREALAVALCDAGIEFAREMPLLVHFRGKPIGLYKPDFLIASAVIVECKAATALTDAHQAQLLNYLRASGVEVGLLLNFGPAPLSSAWSCLLSIPPQRRQRTRDKRPKQFSSPYPRPSAKIRGLSC